MSPLGTRMAAIAAALAAMYPARKVRRSFVDFAQLPEGDLRAGVYTLVSKGEHDFTSVSGYIAMDGTHDIVLLGQLVLQEKAAGEEIEEAEFTMIEEVKAFCRNLPAALCSLQPTSFGQSQQMTRPYGWIGCDLVYVP